MQKRRNPGKRRQSVNSLANLKPGHSPPAMDSSPTVLKKRTRGENKADELETLASGTGCTLRDQERKDYREPQRGQGSFDDALGTTTAIKTRLINEIITDMKQKLLLPIDSRPSRSGASTQIQQFKLSQEAEEGILDVIINVMQDNE